MKLDNIVEQVVSDTVSSNIKNILNEEPGGVSFFFGVENKERKMQLEKEYKEELAKSGLMNFSEGKVLYCLTKNSSKESCGIISEVKGDVFVLKSLSMGRKSFKEYSIKGLLSLKNTFDSTDRVVKFAYSLGDNGLEVENKMNEKINGPLFSTEEISEKLKFRLSELVKNREEKVLDDSSLSKFLYLDKDYFYISNMVNSFQKNQSSITELASNLKLEGKTFLQVKKIIRKEKTDLKIKIMDSSLSEAETNELVLKKEESIKLIHLIEDVMFMAY